uniref:Putative secreted protein n=1 Tax=Ixodes ricinus TaxID=34613 RepID=A0A6B0UN99_IXORI
MKAEFSRMFIGFDVTLLRWYCCLHGTCADASHESRSCACRVATPGEGRWGFVLCNKGVSVRHLPVLDLHASYLFLQSVGQNLQTVSLFRLNTVQVLRWCHTVERSIWSKSCVGVAPWNTN